MIYHNFGQQITGNFSPEHINATLTCTINMNLSSVHVISQKQFCQNEKQF